MWRYILSPLHLLSPATMYAVLVSHIVALKHILSPGWHFYSAYIVVGQGRNYHWGRRGNCETIEKERERERKRKWAKDNIPISALLKGIFGMWCLSEFIFVFEVGCYSGFIFAVSQMLDLLLLISHHISEIGNYLW